MCSHAKNMHYDCIKRLDRCPLCRVSFVKVAKHVPRDCSKNFSFCSICGSMFLLFIYLMICPLRVCYVINGNGHHLGNHTNYN